VKLLLVGPPSPFEARFVASQASSSRLNPKAPEDRLSSAHDAKFPSVAPADRSARTKARLPSNVIVDLSQSYNSTGIYTEGSEFSSGSSLDHVGSAFPAEVLGPGKEWEGVTFRFGPANAPDAVASQSIELPSGKFNGLYMLAVGVEGNQESQVFRVTYADGTSTAFSQSLSDWYTPKNFIGESDVLVAPYRLLLGGSRDKRAFHLYGYSFPLDGKRKVQSVTLPSNQNVKVFALTLVRGSAGNLSSALRLKRKELHSASIQYPVKVKTLVSLTP